MENFGVRTASPLVGQVRRAPPARAAAQLRRVLQGALRLVVRAVDEAPFDLAWPPSPHVLPSRAAWMDGDDRRWRSVMGRAP